MVKIELIQALRNTAERLQEGVCYQWGHMGSCNCGHLAQTITQLSKAEIHSYAMEKHGEWADQVLEFCPSSGYPMDQVISSMLELGLTQEDLMHLERLSCPKILEKIPFEKRNVIKRNNRDDVVLYMDTWADLLEENLVYPVEEVTPVLTP